MRIQQIGVISDTHGLMRPEALKALKGSELIIHAGDIGKAQVLEALRALAPVLAVRGNTDLGDWAGELPRSEVVLVGERHLYVLHNLLELDLDPAAAGLSAVISGHTHRPSISRRNGVLFLNPGSAGPGRFTSPVTVARLRVRGDSLEAQIICLEV